MQRLNAAVDLERQTPEAVARRWREEALRDRAQQK
jgi:glycine betaine/choline ABC-type transport system substrate-binding protein